MKWIFRPHPKSSVENEVTQRDQFRNDDVGLATALVRETVQNSMDAGNLEGPVKVTFTFADPDTGLKAGYLESLLEGHAAHFEASGYELDKIDFDNPRALIVEDFNTTGLTGSLDGSDEDHFSDFWWRHGVSHKDGKSGGRWGLGKLVYSFSSRVNTFFGLTVRKGDERPSLMGQTVLRYHNYNDARFPPHSFFAEGTESEDNTMPIQDRNFVEDFSRQFGIRRKLDTGLSIVIPFPRKEISPEVMIRAGIDNYFYPIITGQLLLQVDDVTIDAANIRDLAQRHLENQKQTEALYEFIEELHEMDDVQLIELRESWFDDKKLNEEDFVQSDLVRIKSDFANGRLVGLKLPINLKTKNGAVQKTSFKVYLKKPPGLADGRDLYVRGCLTVPGEAKFGSRRAFGAMIADDEHIASFLADAETPNHTKWNLSTEKLRKNYQAPDDRVRAIRHSIKQLYDLLAGIVDEEDSQTLKKFFWREIEEAAKRPRRKGEKTPQPPTVDPNSTPKPLRVEKVNGGFRVRPTGDLVEDMLPLKFSVRVAYAVIKGDPYKAHKTWDFDFTGKSGPSPDLKATTDVVTRSKELVTPNTLGFEVSASDFVIQLSGFDENRDLVYKLRTLEGTE